jgi:uncharacterized membrane protein
MPSTIIQSGNTWQGFSKIQNLFILYAIIPFVHKESFCETGSLVLLVVILLVASDGTTKLLPTRHSRVHWELPFQV